MKRLLSVRVLLQTVTSVMTVALIAACAVYAAAAAQNREDARRVPAFIDISNDLFAAMQTYRLERGNVVASLVTPGVPVFNTQSEIAELRIRSGDALDSALRRLAKFGMTGLDPLIEDLRVSRDAFLRMRGEVDAALQMPQEWRPNDLGTHWVAAYNNFSDAVEHLSDRLEDELGQTDPFVAKMVRIKQIAWTVRSDTGRDRFRLALQIASGGRLSEESRLEFTSLNGRIDGVWKLIEDQTAIEATPQALKDAVAEANKLYFSDFRSKHDAIVADLVGGKPLAISAPEWMSLAAPGEESIFQVGKTALNIANAYGLEESAAAERHFDVAIGLMILFSTLGVLTSVYVFRGVVRPINKITETMRSLADGNLACDIPYGRRVDEIGELSHGLRVFRDNAIEKQRMRIEKDGAEAASRAKSEFLANVSHELRTPLNAVIGFSEAMKSEIFGSLSDRYRSYAGDIFTSGSHLLGLINEILDLSKLEAGRLELHDEAIDLPATVEACINLVETQAQQSKIALSVSLDPNYLFLRVDERRFRQILINLLSNAVKFTPEGGRVRVSSSAKNGGLAIDVADTGIGMAAEDIPKAMMPFGQVDSKISRKHEGTGLGLPLAKHLVELHGGTMTIESVVNAGTTVTIVFPQERIVAMPERSRIAGAA